MDVRLYHTGRGACIGWALSRSLYNPHLTNQSLLIYRSWAFSGLLTTKGVYSYAKDFKEMRWRVFMVRVFMFFGVEGADLSNTCKLVTSEKDVCHNY